MSRSLVMALAGVVTAVSAVAACGSSGSPASDVPDAAASTDGAAGDGALVLTPDAGGDTASSEGGIGVVPGDFHDVTQAGNWSFHALSSSNHHGGTFDGRYVYFAPGYPGSTLLRYDTTGAFDAAGAWTSVALSTVLGSDAGSGFIGGGGASFDGRYLYVIGGGIGDAMVMRYDTTASITAAASWSRFDVATAAPSTKGLGGSTFDGRYLYVVASDGYETTPALRYDTTAPFDVAASWVDWRSFQFGSLQQSADTGVLFDGTYVYFVPAGSTLIRFDTRMDFKNDGAWSNVHVTDEQYFGGAFDGRSLYLAPNLDPNGGAAASGFVQRVDPANVSASPLSAFDTKTLDPKAGGFNGAGYDGRYVYLVPFYDGTRNSGLLARVDTAADFGAAASWRTFDLTTLDPAAASFAGSIFDGRYLYLVPNQSKVVARFDARSTPQMPPLPAFHGSFK